MPSTTHIESLIGIPEVIDGIKPLDPPSSSATITPPALQARRSSHASFPPLGPPDMLYLTKRYTPAIGTPKLYGYYHFIRGVTPSSVAQISTYIMDVVSNRGLDTPSWMISPMSSSYTIVSATYLSYNFLNKTDLIVHVDFPGGTSAKIVDSSGKDIQHQQLTDNTTTLIDSDLFWSQLIICEKIRHFIQVGEIPMYPCLRVLPPVVSHNSDHVLFNAACVSVNTWYLSGSDSRLLLDDQQDESDHDEADDIQKNEQKVEEEDEDIPLLTASKSRIATTIRDHFISHSRYEAAIQFFTQPQLLEADPENAVHAATAARLSGNLELASDLIETLLSKIPYSDVGYLEKAHIYRAKNQITEALKCVEYAAKYHGNAGDVIFWSSIADLYVDESMYGKALTSLNEAEMPAPVLDSFLRLLLRDRNSETSPVVGGGSGMGISENGDIVRVLTKKLREERNFTSERTDEGLIELPAKLMAEVDRVCYSVLVKVLNALSWDRMLSVRGECFVMETDVENGPANDDGTHNDEKETGKIDEQEETNERNDDEGDESIINGTSIISLNDDDADGDGDASSPSTMVSDSSVKTTSMNGESESKDEKSKRLSTNRRKIKLEKGGKKVCKPWLDYLVTNMYNDLRAMAQWTAEEQQQQQQATAASLAAAAAASRKVQSLEANSSTSNATSNNNDSSSSANNLDRRTSVAAGEIDLEAPPTDSSSLKRSPEDVAASSIRPPADWLRRGELGLRLGKVEEARIAHQVCVNISEREKKVNVTSLIRLMKLASNDGDTRAALRYADAIWNFMDASTNRKTSSPITSSAAPTVSGNLSGASGMGNSGSFSSASLSSAVDDHSPPIDDLKKAVFKLISSKGLCAVRDVLTTPSIDVNRKRFEGLLLDAVALRVDGFSR